MSRLFPAISAYLSSPLMGGVFLLALFSVSPLNAATNNPGNWVRGDANSVYAEWDIFSDETGSSDLTDATPDVGSANLASGVVSETTGGAFISGGNIYGFGGGVNPSIWTIAIVGNSEGPVIGDGAIVYLQLITRGSALDTTSVKLGGVSAASTQLLSSTLLGGMGGTEDVYLFSWSAASVANWTFGFAATSSHMSLALVAVDILSAGSPVIIDTDSDGNADSDDNCPLMANADQSDTDHDGLGDLCDVQVVDTDNDGISDDDDVFPTNSAVPSVLSGQFKEKLAISGCKTSVRGPSVALNYIPSQYDITLSDGLGFSGGYSVAKPESKYRLSVDASSQNALLSGLNIWANNICAGGATVKSLQINKYEMIVNKQKTQMKMSGKATVGVLLNVKGKDKIKKGTYSFSAILPLNVKPPL